MLQDIASLEESARLLKVANYQAKQGSVVELMFKMIMIGPLYIFLDYKKCFQNMTTTFETTRLFHELQKAQK